MKHYHLNAAFYLIALVCTASCTRPLGPAQSTVSGSGSSSSSSSGSSGSSGSGSSSIPVAFTTSWPFDLATSSVYDATKIEVTGGVARLIALDQTDNDNSATGFSTATYSSTQWSAANSGVQLTLSTSSPLALPNLASTTSWTSMASNVLLLHLNEGVGITSFADTSGFNNTATCVTCPTLNSIGKVSTAGDFTNAPEITVLHSASLDLLGSMTLMAWVTADTLVDRDTIIMKTSNNAWNDGYGLYYEAGNICVFIRSRATATACAPFTTTANFRHVAATYNGAALIVYIDGIKAATTSTAVAISSSAGDLRIGNGAGVGYYWDGKIDEVAIFNAALSFEQISNIYQTQSPLYSGQTASRVLNATTSASWSSIAWTPSRPSGKPLPDSGNAETAYSSGNVSMSSNALLAHLNESAGTSFTDTSGFALNGLCTTTTCPTLGPVGKFSRAPFFDGVDDWIDFTNPMGLQLGIGSIEAWVRTTNPGAGLRGIAVKNGAYGLFLDSGVFAAYDYNAAVARSSGINIADGKWHHIGATFQSGVANGTTLYIDGIARITTTITLSSQGTGFTIGAGSNPGVTQNFAGLIDEVAIYSRLLSSQEMTDRYYRGVQRLNFQVKSCNDAACATGTLAGPAAVTTSYYAEADASTTGLPSVTLSGVGANQYFQYQAYLETDLNGLSPTLKSVSIGPTHYDGTSPIVVNTTGTTYSDLSFFSATLGASNSGTVTYQLSHNGTSWYYHNSTTWVAAAGVVQSNTAAQVASNISTFKSVIGAGTIYWRAYLTSASAAQACELDTITIAGSQ